MSEKSFKITFKAIELISKSIAEPPRDFQGVETFSFNFLIDLKVAPEQKTAFVITESGIIWAKEMKEVAKFRILCAFELPDFDSVFTKIDNNKYDTPVDLEIILKSAGLSTIRGIIAMEVKGTYLQGAVLPLIDVNTLVREQRKLAEQNKMKVG